jgi:hypothetical protein
MMRWLRWLLMIPSAWASWYVALVIGVHTHSALEALLCPREQIVSGMCAAAWFEYVSRGVMCAGAGLAAALILVTCALIAPSHRSQVVAVTLVAGVVAALVMGVLATAYPECITALVVGGVVAMWLRKSAWVRSPT